ncbi:MAG: sigma-70 family RNA polymerase sigma factor [bacterium]|nr:sigma-70 family RNA polymerase sigma factor [bacterium]
MSVTLEMEKRPVMSTAQTSDSGSILQRIAAGEQTAVAECIDTYGSMVWSIARRYCASHADAEDATQEVFIELWKKASQYQSDKATEATFISMVARRRLIDRLRRKRVESESMSIEEIELPDLNFSESVEAQDEAAKAMHCIDQLSHEQRSVIVLSIHQGISHQKIADKLSMPLGTVKSYARRALIQLRDCMKHKRHMAPFHGANA